ncbi:hydrophobe/amphiphile efflux-1 (HAE1) family protein [Mucilaginibacter sp. OK268]|uniref:efflux RND transporter permease subunit n=1 Tax=Mucilaginibacter sp. OK268 TaxID=1881048 RepID=UPI000886FD8A|nr:efflux RND transporter permease subunit [Mucilaginibacter sp. OK268]SDP27846.1 hydrophobe/amphiphile efflux-1 (HAE1) family protein [Mucilaginibacter sp. OK268]
MSITGLAIKRPILFIVFFLILGGLSVISYQNLKYELLPNLATPTITVITAYPGASPEDVENSVTKKIEDAVAGVSKSKKVNSLSADNLSVVSIEFMADANPDQAMQEVQRTVNGTLSDFPEGVKAPVLEKFNVNDLPVLKLAVTAAITPTELYDLVNNRLKPRLAQVKGVGKVKILGGTPKEIKVLAKQDKLISNGLSITDLYETIRKANADYPVGTIKDKDAQFGVKLGGKLTDTNQVKNLKIKNYPDGSSLSVKDVATVKISHKDEEISSRLNGQSSIALFINKQSGANAAEVTKVVREELQKIEQEYAGKKIRFNVAQDSSEFTLEAAHQVYDDLGIAILLVALVMLVFLHSIRNSLIIMVSIPASLFSAFIMMYALDYSLNLMTLLAMSLVIGVLVDDSIVVLENIYHHLEKGKDKWDAALDGRNEIGFAALSITLVDVVVFLPMTLVPGLVGSLIKEFSLVIVVSTLSSLIVSFTLTPMIASRFAKLEHLSTKTIFGRAGLWFEARMHDLTDGYGRLLTWGLNHRIVIGLIAITILGGSLTLLTSNTVGTEFLPTADKGELSLFVDLQPGTKLAETDSTVRIIENKLKTVPEITKVFSNTGYQNDGFNEKYSSNLATINVSLIPSTERKKSLSQLSRDLKALSMEVTGVKSRVSPIGLFGANEAPVQLLITGTNRDSVNTAASIILDHIRSVNGLVSPRLSSESGKPEMKLVADRDQMARLGLNTEAVGDAMRMAVYGNDQLKFRDQDKETDTRIQLDVSDRNKTDQLMKLTFINANNQLVYLSQFAKVVQQSGPSGLERRNKQPSITLLAQVSGRPVGDVGEDLKQEIAKLNLSKDVKVLYEGDLELQDDSFTNLGMALLVSFALIYLIMVTLYNNWLFPLVILFSIPLAISGALLALALTAKSMNVFSIFGLIMMMGLVVKNGILLVDKTNDLLNDDTGIDQVNEALVEAGKARFRPILMTTLAMVIGMLPLALASGASSAFSSGLAWVLIGGLSSSMFLTLVVVPVVYNTMMRLKTSLSNLWQRLAIKKSAGTVALVFIGFMLGLNSVNTAHAQAKISLSLKQAVSTGLNANQQIKLAEIDAQKAKYGLKEAQSYQYPQVGITVEYVRNLKPAVFFLPTFGINSASQITYDDKNLQPINASAKNAYNGNINVSMPLFNEEVAGNVKTAHLNEGLNNANVELSRWELADEIRKAYFNILIARQNLVLTNAALNRSQRNLKDSRLLCGKGYANKSDTLNAWSNVELMKINCGKAGIAVKQSGNYLKSLLNLSLDKELELTDSVGVALLGEQRSAMNDSVQLDHGKRPDLKVNDWKNQIARQQVKNEQSKYLPSLAFVSQYSLQAQSDNFNFSRYNVPNSFYVGIQLTIPIFTGFRTDARVKQSKLALEQVITERGLMENRANLQVRNNRLTIIENTNKIKGQQNIRSAREQALVFIQTRWQRGFAKYTDVADAELQLVQADNDYTQSVFEYLTAVAGYYKATGTIL